MTSTVAPVSVRIAGHKPMMPAMVVIRNDASAADGTGTASTFALEDRYRQRVARSGLGTISAEQSERIAAFDDQGKSVSVLSHG